MTMRQCLHERCEQHDEETTITHDLDQEVSIFRKEIKDATKEIANVKEKLQGLTSDKAKIRKVTGLSSSRQMEITVEVNEKTEKAIIDSGADINYANTEWCNQHGITYEVTGYGKIKAYDESYVQEMIRKATIEFRLNEEDHRQVFHVLKETGKDNMVLGMPWLVSTNPLIDWEKREISTRHDPKTLSTDQEDIGKVSVLRYDTSKTRSQTERDLPKGKGNSKLAGRGGYNSGLRQSGRATPDSIRPNPDETVHEVGYEQRVQEVLAKLPKELHEFKDVFVKEK
jgi:hypothetical protein